MGRGRGDAGTWGRGEAGRRGTRGRGDAGTWGRGDAGTSELGDARGFEDVGDKQIAPHFCAELVKNFFCGSNVK